MSEVKEVKHPAEGGSYERDPVTGALRLLERTDYVPAAEAVPPVEATDEPAASSNKRKNA